MKSIETIIKINKRELDELRKQLVQREEEKEQLIHYHNKMEDELEQEHILSAKDPEMGIMFANYRKMIKGRQAVIVKSLKDLDQHITFIKSDIIVKFGEVKKYEILLASQLAAAKKVELLAEAKQLDEISMNNYLQETIDN